jgi:OOP family OmpA-OmpF porin
MYFEERLMRNLPFLAITVSSLLFGSHAFADAADGDAYVSAMLSFIDADSDRNVNDGRGGWQLGAGMAVSENWNLQAIVHRATLSGPFRQKHSGIGLDIQRVFNRSDDITPYLFAGLGRLDVDLANGPGSDGNMYALGAGVHADVFGDSPVSLNFEYRYRTDKALPGSMRDHIFSIGVQIPFGRARPAAPAAPMDGDGDNDGVRDSADQCPRTPAGRMVNGVGCELDEDNDGVVNGVDQCPNTLAGVTVDNRGCGLDGDNDGVLNGLDRCPNSRAGAQVDARGCEGDTDNDGVVNGLDSCPNTTAGSRVDVRGCEITDEISLPSVEFETNSEALRPGAAGSLNDAATTLNRYPELVVEVAGHTDSDGAESYNLDLSQRRAQTVRNHLINAGIAAARLSARGYGEAQPIASNATAAGKAQNRRVVLRILAQ